MSKIKCSKCGEENDEGNNYCINCGNKFDKGLFSKIKRFFVPDNLLLFKNY